MARPHLTVRAVALVPEPFVLQQVPHRLRQDERDAAHDQNERPIVVAATAPAAAMPERVPDEPNDKQHHESGNREGDDVPEFASEPDADTKTSSGMASLVHGLSGLVCEMARRPFSFSLYPLSL